MTGTQINRRNFLIRSSLLGASAIAGPALLTGCSSTSSNQDTLSQAKKQGYFKIGIAGEIPYGYTDKSGQVTGEAPKVAEAVFKALGVPSVKATQVDFSALIPSLNANQFDMVCAGMDILPARCQQATFSIPDYQALVAFLVPKGNPKKVTTFADVKRTGVTLAAETGAVEVSYATEYGVPIGQVKQFQSPDEMLSAVTTGRAYTAVLTDISLKSLVAQNPSAPVEVTPGFVPVINGKQMAEVGGFVFRKNESSLVSQFNTQLKKLQDSGEWAQIAQPFGFSKANLPPADVTTQQLCSAS